MKIEIDISPEILDMIAERVIEKLKPLLAGEEKRKTEQDEIFNVRSLAYYLKVSTKWIYDLTRSNEIPHVKIKGQLRFRKSEIDTWYQQHSILPEKRFYRRK